ncbi:hypothetical protein D3C84_1154440 [compost metagenome]
MLIFAGVSNVDNAVYSSSAQISSLMPFRNLACLIPPCPVDALAAQDRRPIGDFLCPALHVGVLVG